MAGLLGDKTMKIGATLHGCDVKTRDAFANMDIAGYNYGILRYPHDLKKYPNRLILGSETFCKDAYSFWEQAQNEPRIIGDFVWAGMDYMGEVGIGSWEYADYAESFGGGPGWISAGSGRIDLVGNPLAEAAYTMVAFGLNDKPAIAVQPVNHTRDKHSPSAWKLTNAITSWSWEGCDGEPAVVEVYARAASVELQINGKTVGRKRLRNECRAIFKTVYESGTVTAIAYDDSGREISRSSMHSAAKETVLRVIPEKTDLKPGELCFIRLEYTDEGGIVKPLARDMIQADVKQGSLIGLGNACPYNARGYLTNKTDTYYGRALAAVRADEQGRIDLVVSDSTRQVKLTLAKEEDV